MASLMCTTGVAVMVEVRRDEREPQSTCDSKNACILPTGENVRAHAHAHISLNIIFLVQALCRSTVVSAHRINDSALLNGSAQLSESRRARNTVRGKQSLSWHALQSRSS